MGFARLSPPRVPSSRPIGSGGAEGSRLRSHGPAAWWWWASVLQHMAKNPSSRVLLMRSGRTEWDLLGRVQGAADLPMSSGGLATVQGQLAALPAPKLE